MNQNEVLQLLTSCLDDRSIHGIANGMASLINAKRLPVGSKLPPVRDLAEVLGVSPSTVSAAWKQLRAYRMLAGGGRNGIWVQGVQTSQSPKRFEGTGGNDVHIQIDLRRGSPDSTLLPNLDYALHQAARVENLNSYLREPITRALREQASATWPYVGPAYIATNGGYDGVYLSIAACLMAGSTVAIEDPTSIRILDVLDKLGIRGIGIACDCHGPIPASLKQALASETVAAFIYQPGIHAVTGSSVSNERMLELRKVLEGSQTLIIEDDGLGAVSPTPALSLGSYFPEQTIHIRSYSKSLGPDLRIAVASGSVHLVQQMQAYRNFREGWTSRLLQSTVTWLLQDASSAMIIESSRNEYLRRNNALSTAILQRNVAHTRGPFSIWIPVGSERSALVTLASRGIAARPGNPTQFAKLPHIWVSTSLLTSDYEFVADAIADSVKLPTEAGPLASPD